MSVGIAYKLDMKIERVGGTSMKALLQSIPQDQVVVFLCIGTMKSHGDSIAPRIGKFLQHHTEKIAVIGSTFETVHAKNLDDLRIYLAKHWHDAFIVAVDACVTKNPENIGKITVSRSPLRPGAGIGKEIGEIGHASIRVYTTIEQESPDKTMEALHQQDEQYIANLAFTLGDYLANCVNKFRKRR